MPRRPAVLSPLLSALLLAAGWSALPALGRQGPGGDAGAAEAGGGSGAEDLGEAVGAWDWAAYGNHRAVVEVGADGARAGAVRVTIPWRRRDVAPEGRQLIVIAAASGRRVANVVRLEVSREAGTLAFEPVDGAGAYWVYYLPNLLGGRRNYPQASYPEADSLLDGAWAEAQGLGEERRKEEGARAGSALPAARFLRFEAKSERDRRFPMAAVATAAEVEGLRSRFGDAAYWLFFEDRDHPIEMAHDLPAAWAGRGPLASIALAAERGEFRSFQLGLHVPAGAGRTGVRGVELAATDLAGPGGRIAARGFHSFATGGVDWQGVPFRRGLDVPAGAVQALWCGYEVPETTAPGVYAGTLTVTAEGEAPRALRVELTVGGGPPLAAHGDDEPARLTRLRWLDSTLAHDDSLVRPYTPVTVTGAKGRTLGVLGREVVLGDDGLPRALRSFFAPAMTRLEARPRELLAGPMRLRVELAGGGLLDLRPGPLRVEWKNPGRVSWSGVSTGGPLTVKIDADLEFDGNVEARVEISASEPVDLADVRLEIPFAAETARYLMGLGVRGGTRPATLDWRWDVAARNQDAVWIGTVHAGAQLTLKDDRYVRPLNTNFYTKKPLVEPRSWANGGKGGIRLREEGGAVLLTAFSGARRLERGSPERFDFRLLLTPFHPIDPREQWRNRFYHGFRPLEEIRAFGANVVNVHHATPINPYINYPFFRPREMKEYVDAAHRLGMRVKIYYTVRELTTRAPELFALKSLGHEIFSPGPGGGHSWLQEHLGEDYIPAWYVPELEDTAVVNSGVSRWHNFYIEGLDWLARNVGIDGLYLDDVAFDRVTMQRIRRVLERHRARPMIDLHSANQYNERDGFASSANLYLEHFPYLDRLWFGEYFDYDDPPDRWLVEMSGIPFGLMGEMLEKGGNPWRGMLFGMTSRAPWSGDPRPLWQAWDAFGLAGSEMIGFWADPPVTTGRSDLLATTYRRKGRALVALASWAREKVDLTLAIDWKGLGLDPATATIAAPAIAGFQEGRTFALGEPIPVEPGKGWLLEVR